MYYFSYLSAIFYYKNFVLKRYFEAQAVYLLGKAVLWRVYTGNFSDRQYGESLIYQLLPLMLFAKRALEERPTYGPNSGRLCK
jgi:hypothetical protein